jgi:hypothetical protein
MIGSSKSATAPFHSESVLRVICTSMALEDLLQPIQRQMICVLGADQVRQ